MPSDRTQTEVTPAAAQRRAHAPPESFNGGVKRSHLQSGCCSAGSTLPRAEPRTSAHSAPRCASRPPTPLNYAAPHRCRTPSAASPHLESFLPDGYPRPAQTKTARAPECKMRGSCLQGGCPTLDSASNSSVPTLGSARPPHPQMHLQ